MLQRTIVAAAALLCLAAIVGASPPRPKWLKIKPHVEERAGRKVAVAVGKAQVKKDRALARAAAEEEARGELLKLIKGGDRHGPIEGYIRGAQVVEVYEGAKGLVYVRLELPMDEQAAP